MSGSNKSVVQPGEIFRLAVPAFFTLIAEPLFLLADTAIIGHVGTSALAGMGVASAALLTVVNLCVFLAYSTTASVARKIGQNRRVEAISVGIDSMGLATVLGVALTVLVTVLATPICALFGGGQNVLHQAVAYLQISALGIPAVLISLAATGLLRGLQNTKTPLLVTSVGFSVNLVLNVILVLGLHLGVAGAAWGTVISQWGMSAAYLLVVRKIYSGSLHWPKWLGILASAKDGVPLFIRTLALRAALLSTTWVVSHMGATSLAAHQIATTIWSFLAFALDALAIAAQALTGHWLGAKDVVKTKAATWLLVRYALVYGTVLGVLMVLTAPIVPIFFTEDQQVRSALIQVLPIVGLAQPICALAYILDGVLIGAGDARWLAGAQIVMLVAYLPALGWVHWGWSALIPLWLAYVWFMSVRAGILAWRARGAQWMRVN